MDMKLNPRISEKTIGLAARGIYTFDAPTTANKQQICEAIAAQFGVHVTGIKTVVARGKVVRSQRKGGSPMAGRRVARKKAYVTLTQGEKIDAFEQEDNA